MFWDASNLSELTNVIVLLKHMSNKSCGLSSLLNLSGNAINAVVPNPTVDSTTIISD